MNNELIFIILIIVALAVAVRHVRKYFRHEYVVNDGFVALFHRNGILVDALPAGCHACWGRHCTVTLIDTRKTLLLVAGQEVLTADNVSVKVSLVLTTQVVNAVKAVQAVAGGYATHIYSATQSAVRDAVAGVGINDLLGKRIDIAAQVRDALVKLEHTIGVHVHAVEVRDVMLPGDLRKAFTEVLKAKQDGLAALERARGESAAIRNLLNAARLVEGQPALATLRFIQALGGSGDSRTVVMNDMSAFAPLAAVRAAAKRPATDAGET